AGQELKTFVDNRSLENYPTGTPVLALQTILDNIQEKHSFSTTGKLQQILTNEQGEVRLVSTENENMYLWDTEGNLLTKFKNHQDIIFKVAVSPDGDYLLSSGRDEKVYLWDLQGNLLTEFKGHEGLVYHVTFNPKSDIIATMAKDGTARLWNFQGEELSRVQGYLPVDGEHISRHSNHLVFNPAGDSLATISNTESDKNTIKVHLWDLQGNELLQSQRFERRISDISFSASGEYLIADHSYLLDLQVNQITVFEGYTSVFSPQGHQLVIANDQGVSIHDLQGNELDNLELNFIPYRGKLAFSHNGDRLAIGTADGTVYLWDIISDTLTSFKGHSEEISQIFFSPEGNYLITGSNDWMQDSNNNMIRLWNLQGNELIHLDKHPNQVQGVLFSPQSKYLATFGIGNVNLWDLQGNRLAQIPINNDQGVMFSPEGDRLATLNIKRRKEDNSIQYTTHLWDLRGNELDSFEGRVNFTHQDSPIVSSHKKDDKLQMLDWSGKEFALLEGFDENPGFGTVFISPHGDLLYMYDNAEEKTRFWDLEGNELDSISGEVIFSSEDNRLASYNSKSQDSNIRLLNLQGKELMEFENEQNIMHATFGPDNNYLVVSDRNGTLSLWDLHTKKRTAFKAFRGLGLVDFVPESNWLASIGFEGTARLWTIEGQQIAEYEGNLVRFSPDGKYIATVDDKNNVKLWESEDLDGLLAKGCDWLDDYLTQNPEVLERLEVCQDNG
ncbi:MAG: WD40 repeat domain-containing protein, partial [Cyanobacteria bacterium P01_F01_bin.53]